MNSFLSEISNSFLQIIRISDFPWKALTSAIRSGEIDQLGVTDATICHPLAKLYSPNAEYIKIFSKRLISELEDNEIEVSEIIYNNYIGLISRPQYEEYYYCTYTLNKLLKITLRETKTLIIEGTTGLTTWLASHVLVQYCLENSFLFKSRKILELGSGLGLTGLAVIKSSYPKSYTFTDHHPKVLEYLRHNVNVNLRSSDKEIDREDGSYVSQWQETRICINILDWESPTELQDYDYVIGADILYDARLIPYVVATLTTCLRTRCCKAVLAATLRKEETFSYFLKEADKSGLRLDHMEERSYQESASQPKAMVKIMLLSFLNKYAAVL